MTKHNTLWLAVIIAVIASLLAVPAASAAPQSTTESQAADTKSFLWEEMGITFEIPSDWEAFPATADYDLALVSPASSAGDENGAFLTLQSIPYLGQTFEEALQPLAEDTTSTVEEYPVGGQQGMRVVSANAEAAMQSWMVLFAYNDGGESVYAQGSVPDAEVATLEAIFASITINQLTSDADAINAAWQASLAKNGTLVYGNEDAPVHIAEYLSFTCGHCANYTVSVERLIALEVEDAGRVRFELAPVMWDEYASRTSRAFYCAVEQGQGYTAYKAIYHGYFADGYDVAYTDEGLTAIMSGLGLDTDAYATCVQEDRYASVIAGVETRFRDGGITATPTITFGMGEDEPAPIPVGEGEIWSGAIPLSTVRVILSMLIDDGIAVQDLYSAQE